jgi:hypothetical protein
VTPTFTHPSPLSRADLAELGERIARLQTETAAILADAREAIRRSRETVAHIQVANARDHRSAVAPAGRL